jgi:hypothetical protein
MLLAISAQAHWADLAVSQTIVGEKEVQINLTLPTGLLAFADTDQSGRLSPEEVVANKQALEAFLGDKIQLSSTGQKGQLNVSPLSANLAPVNPKMNQSSHSNLRLTYIWSAPIEALTFRYDLFIPEAPKASNLMTISQGDTLENTVFTPEKREYTLGDRAHKPVDFAGFMRLGFDHILGGLDHLLFLLALLALGGGLGYLLKVITSFTVAHSITLFLTATGIINFPAQFIESGIALSIAYVAAENLFRRNTPGFERTRVIVTFLFGLLHGMGFADILKEIGVPSQNLLGSVIGFNLGVELGQLVVVIPLFLLLMAIKRWPMEVWVRRLASVGAMVAGLIWFVERAFSI